MKTCTKCNEKKPLSAFSKHRLTRDGYAYQCKECGAKRAKKWRSTPAGIYTIISSRVNFRNKFKKYHRLYIKKEEFVDWYNKQEKLCVYCDINEDELQSLPDYFNNNSTRLTIDCKDSQLGYSLNNIVLACWRCNIIKGDLLSFDEMMYIGQNFVKPKWEALRKSVSENE